VNDPRPSTLNVPLIAPGYKQTEVGVIPEDWEVVTAFEACSKIQDGTHFSPRSGGNDYLYVTSRNIRFGHLDLSNAGWIDAAQHQAIYRRCDVKKGDLLLTKDGASTGNAALNTLVEEFSLLSSVAFLRFNPNKHCAAYFLQQVLAPQGQRQIQDAMAGNAITRLTLEKINKLRFPLPPTKAEQEAIAEALSDADALIESLEQLLVKKRQLKQGAMQDLLTGKKRLPGFEVKPGYKHTEMGDIPEDWRVEAIEEISTVGRGRVISHREIARSRDLRYPVYSSQTSNNGVMGYLDTFEFEGEYITWTTDGANAGTVFARNSRFNCTNVCGTIKLKSDNHVFAAGVLGRIAPSHVSRHLGNPKLMNDVMKRIKIPLPPNRAEQDAIATILSDMDAEIAALDAKLAKARQLKQGMMQELLTGRIRLVESAKLRVESGA
jgi:type I restriction enzyme S subunit